MLSPRTTDLLLEWAETYNDPKYFEEDPISFPRKFLSLYREGGCSLQDIEIAALFAAHFAWGRRAMIVRDTERLLDEMDWRPYDYVLAGDYRNDPVSIHRTVKWSEVALICSRLRDYYLAEESSSLGGVPSLEGLSPEEFRTRIFGQKSDPKAPCKKIHMMRRWMVRTDGRVDLGLWRHSSQADLLIPLDVHVHEVALSLGLTSRTQKDLRTVLEITRSFDSLFPGDPCKGDFALFGYGVTHKRKD